MQKSSNIALALKQAAVCLPPVIISLIGLAALSRKKGGRPVVAGEPAAPVLPVAVRRSGRA